MRLETMRELVFSLFWSHFGGHAAKNLLMQLPVMCRKHCITAGICVL